MVTMTSGSHFSTCSTETTASPPLVLARDIARAEKFDGLDIDGAAEPGLEPVRSARVVDARALAFRNPVDARRIFSKRILGIGRKRLGVAPGQLAEQAIGRGITSKRPSSNA